MRFKLVKDLNDNTSPLCVLMITEGGMSSSVPNVDSNKDWQVFQDWLANGNSPEPADESTQPLSPNEN